MATRRTLILALASAAGMATAARIAPVAAQRAAAPRSDLSPDENFAVEHEIGRRFRFDPASLPPPGLQRSVSNGPRTVAYAGQGLNVPPGFTATHFATGVRNPRRILVLANGDVLVAQQSQSQVALLHDDGGGRAASNERYAGGFNEPYGLAWRGSELLVADQDGLWRVSGQGGRPEPITRQGVFGADSGHRNRPIAIDPRSGALFAGVGSMGNIAVEPEPKATVQYFAPDGSGQTTYAAGARNPTTLAIHPQTGELWAGVQERDGLGDNLPSDYLIRVRQGGFYGWPYAYLGPNPQPGFAERAPDRVAATIVPDLLFQAHSSVLDLIFYEGAQFPPQYRGGAFAALKGSWNRSLPTGYKVVFVPFQNGQPAGHYENFATGFWTSGERRADVWGRPAALAVARDGSLLVGDDTGGTIWRIAYGGGR
ncbi:MAG: sorbosone dehydrogenase family protein [Alphaproteobacteria bacterium]